MMELGTVLDKVQEDISKEYPHLSDLEAAFSAIRFNLHALTGVLIQFGMTGQDLPNEMLQGVCGGLITTLEWMAAKEEAFEDIGRIEDALNNGTFEDGTDLGN